MGFMKVMTNTNINSRAETRARDLYYGAEYDRIEGRPRTKNNCLESGQYIYRTNHVIFLFSLLLVCKCRVRELFSLLCICPGQPQMLVTRCYAS